MAGHSHGLGHSHDGDEHAHTHGVIDPTIATTSRGIWAIKWSFVGLAITAGIQVVIVVLSGSVALLADTVHNVGDALTAVPLWVAFLFARRPPSKQFTYGFGRVEDLAGVVIVLVITFSAAFAAYQAIDRLLNPRDIAYVWVVAGAGAVGFIGNEAVAIFRIRVGREIHSAALIADGHHARVDGFTSLAVLGGAIAVGVGYPIADPIVALVITVLITRIAWDSAKAVFTRMLDGVDPDVLDEIAHTAGHVDGVIGVSDVRARWSGHRLETEVHLTMRPSATVAEAHELTLEVCHQLSHAMPFIAHAVVHVDPMGRAGLAQHRTDAHEHDGLEAHAH